MVDDPGTLPRHLRPDEEGYSLEARVRSYLDVNCSYCHRPGGGSGGVWDGRAHLPLSQTGLVNAPPAHPPLVPGDLLVEPGSVEHSLLYTRPAAARGYDRMPPLATDVVDLEGVQLLADWIASEVRPHADYREWRIAHFGDDSSAAGEPGADPDGDGATNEHEWLTHTAPNDPRDFWRTTLAVHPDHVELEYPGLGDRRVTAYHSPDLLHWLRVPDPSNDGVPRPTGEPQSLSTPRSGDAGFFRFEVEEN